MYNVMYCTENSSNRWESFCVYGSTAEAKKMAYDVAHKLAEIFAAVEMHITPHEGDMIIERIPSNEVREVSRTFFPKKENHYGYAFFQGKPTVIHKRVSLEVTVILDLVPGAFHQVEDHMNWICNLPYVQDVKVMP